MNEYTGLYATVRCLQLAYSFCMFQSFNLISFQWLVCAKYVQMQRENKDHPFQIMKQQVNATERRAVLVYRVLSFGLFALLAGSELIGVKPDKCSI